MLDATETAAESLVGPQPSPTHRDRIVALRLFDPDLWHKDHKEAVVAGRRLI